MSDVLFDIVMGAILVIIIIVGYCCLAMASEQERISEEEWEKHEKGERHEE